MRFTTVFAIVSALLLEGALAAPAENSPALANAEEKRQGPASATATVAATTAAA